MQGDDIKIGKCDCSDICEMCIKGKMSRKPFPKKATPTNDILDCVVSDVCGPIQVESLGRKRYFVSFIDAYSNYTDVQFINKKSDVFLKTFEFIEKMKNQIGRKPKVFRSDRGKEYMCEKLQSYLRKEGISFQCTVGYAPEQNGIAERKNRTLVEAARSMLTESGLPKCLWAEAVSTANYVLNRLENSKLKLSPYEAIFKKKPKVNETYEFGCNAYVMIPYERRQKLDDKAIRVKFVGYDENAKGYRFVDENLKIIVSREVRFLDTKYPFKNIDEHQKSGEIDVIFDHVNDENAELFEGTIIEIDSDDEVESQFYDVDNGDAEQEREDDENDEDHENVEDHEDDEREVEPPPIHPQPTRRTTRSTANIPPVRYRTLVAKCDNDMFEPRTYKQALTCSKASEWIEAMKEELKSIEDNGTWCLVDLPRGREAVGSRWVYKLKRGEAGQIVRYKARLVAQGYSQKFGVDYDEVFAPVARSSTVRLLLSVAGVNGYKVKHYDIKTAFLNGELNEEIYLKQPPGFSIGDKVYRLRKSLYGLKQAARVWNLTLHRSLIKNGFKQCENDKCLYYQHSGGEINYLLVHVDDLLIATSNEKILNAIMCNVKKDFKQKDLGEVKHYLGIDVNKDESGHYTISQSGYIDKIVEAAKLSDAKVSKVPVDPGYFKLEGVLLQSNDEY